MTALGFIHRTFDPQPPAHENVNNLDSAFEQFREIVISHPIPNRLRYPLGGRCRSTLTRGGIDDFIAGRTENFKRQGRSVGA